MTTHKTPFAWTHELTDRYVVTGYTRNGKRFRQIHSNPYWAFGVNLYRGSVWLLRDNKRKLLKRVWN